MAFGSKVCFSWLGEKVVYFHQQNFFSRLKAGFITVIIAGSLLGFMPKAALALGPTLPVGGIFLPGLFDIYTPTLFCGLLVSVAGPNGGVFTFLPVDIYDYFLEVPFHAGTNMLGLASPPTACPPALFMFGSSLLPGI